MTKVNADTLSIVEVKALLLDEIDKMEVSNRNAQQLRNILNQKIQQADVKQGPGEDAPKKSEPDKKEEIKPPVEGEKK